MDKEIGVISQKDSVIESIVEWSIEDFLSLPAEVDDSYHSPVFSFANESWWLTIYPNGRSWFGFPEELIQLFLNKEFSGPRMEVEIKLGVKTVDGKLDYEEHYTKEFDDTLSGRFISQRIHRSLLIERKSHLLPSDTLTLIFRMKGKGINEDVSSSSTVPTGCTYCNKALAAQEDIQCHLRKCEDLLIHCQNCSNGATIKNWYDHKCQMTDAEGKECSSGSIKILLKDKVLEDYKELFLKQKECDVIIRVKEQEFPAHKAILAARSSVFESTFRNDMKEKESGIVNVKDCDPSSFSHFLCFLYCGETENLSEENVFSLFSTADKYDVQDLRDVCVKFMKENISVDTFCDTLTLALLHCESELVILATDFFIKNAKKIVKTVPWQRFLDDNPTQSNELIIKLLQAGE